MVLYQPDIPQNLGAMLRISACFGMPLHIIEPCGFPLDDKRLRRAGMDYIDQAELHRHASWESFQNSRKGGRLVVLSTKANALYSNHAFAQEDYLLFGRESAGLPEPIHAAADIRLRIPMRAEARSLNLATSAAIVCAEAMRQQQWKGLQ